MPGNKNNIQKKKEKIKTQLNVDIIDPTNKSRQSVEK
jgi:hypothetical protein